MMGAGNASSLRAIHGPGFDRLGFPRRFHHPRDPCAAVFAALNHPFYRGEKNLCDFHVQGSDRLLTERNIRLTARQPQLGASFNQAKFGVAY
jgi:hypothetical protein